MSITDSPTEANAASVRKTLGRKSAIAGFAGTALEYYDYFIYGTAASLVFGQVIFGGGQAALLASLATFGVSYVARPFGGIVLGSLGDRIGRRKVLLFTIILMGVSTFCIGCIPTFEQAGWISPILLVTCRILQGFSCGGESAGTSSLTMENSPANRRNFYSGFTITGCNFGIILANSIFIPIQLMPEADRMSWGWRIPFWISAVIVVIAYFIRRSLIEPEVFTQAKEKKQIARFPILTLLRTDPGTLIKCIIMMLVGATDTAFMVFCLSYGTNTVGVESWVMLMALVIGMSLGMIGQPLLSLLSDTIGRKPVFVFGCIASALALFVYFSAIDTKSTVLIVLGAILYRSFSFGAWNVVYIGWFPELFPVTMRYTGAATGIQVGLVVAGFTPMISAMLVPSGSTDWLPIPIFLSILCVFSAIAGLLSKETFKTPTEKLGLKDSMV